MSKQAMREETERLVKEALESKTLTLSTARLVSMPDAESVARQIAS
jgi:hypothetical protein